MNAQVMRLAHVPRTVTQELDPVVPEHHLLSVVGFFMMLIGIVALPLSLFVVWKFDAPWLSTSIGPLLGAVGYVMRQLVRPKALAAGRERVSRMPLSLVTVVQANRVLYKRRTAEHAPAVIAYAIGPAALDPGYMLNIARHIASLRGYGTTNDPELARIGALLDQEDSNFSLRLPRSYTGDSEVVVQTTILAPQKLPRGHLTDDTVLAGLLDEDGRLFTLLPPETYSEPSVP